MKLRRKLLAAGFALGATALTLTTSTFAWYTANTEVSMTGVQGASAASDGSTLLISSTGVQGSFGSSVTLTTNVDNLQPVEYTAGAANTGTPTFKKIQKDDTNAATDTNVDADNVLSFDLWFKASAATPVYLNELKITNTTGVTQEHPGVALPTKDILSIEGTKYGTPEAAATDAVYTADVLRSLKMAWFTVSTKADATTPVISTSASQARKLDNLVTPTTDSLATGTWNAHQYYNAVSGENIDTAGTKSVSGEFTLNSAAHSSITMGTTPAGLEKGTDLKMTVYFFIDGWDLDCFDACQGQTFTISMKFSSLATTTLNKAA